jgi:hypothetical protein
MSKEQKNGELKEELVKCKDGEIYRYKMGIQQFV